MYLYIYIYTVYIYIYIFIRKSSVMEHISVMEYME